MNKQHVIRLKQVLFGAVFLGLSAWLIVDALSEGLNLYVTPSSLDQSEGQVVYLGGEVVKNSVSYHDGIHQFRVADDHNEIQVVFSGTLPAMFKAERDAVMIGQYKDNIFTASKVLAKHDEYYRPKDQRVLENDS